jgi:cytochrome c biogenesis factor
MAGDITDPENEIILEVAEPGQTDFFETRPKLFWASRMEALMRRPAIHRHLLYDMYFAPETVQEPSETEGIELVKGDTVRLGGYFITFLEFEQQSHAMGGPMTFGALLNVTDSAGNSETISPAMVFAGDQGVRHEDVPLMSGRDSLAVRLEKIYADQGAVRITVAGLMPEASPERLVLEVSKKPTMNILWAGSIILVFGGLVSLRRRYSAPVTGG